jgi:hypothetical protein
MQVCCPDCVLHPAFKRIVRILFQMHNPLSKQCGAIIFSENREQIPAILKFREPPPRHAGRFSHLFELEIIPRKNYTIATVKDALVA